MTNKIFDELAMTANSDTGYLYASLRSPATFIINWASVAGSPTGTVQIFGSNDKTDKALGILIGTATTISGAAGSAKYTITDVYQYIRVLYTKGNETGGKLSVYMATT